MKAITIIQPWASLIMATYTDGRPCKPIETRTHAGLACLKGERIAIHAGLAFDHDAAEIILDALDGDVSGLPFPEEYLRRHGPWPRGAVLGTAFVEDARWLTWADTPRALCCADGLFGLILRDHVRFDPPLGARGRQGIWNWDAGCLPSCAASLGD